jgi:hypothetical protein
VGVLELLQLGAELLEVVCVPALGERLLVIAGDEVEPFAVDHHH